MKIILMMTTVVELGKNRGENMSAGYGYIRIQFTKADGSADAEIAKKAYEYCVKHFDFFNTTDGRFQEEADAEEAADWEDNWEQYGDAFKLNEEEIRSAYLGDGLDIEGACPESVEEDWIQEVYEEFKPYQMKVQFHEDFSESSFDSNTVVRYQVKEEDGERKLVECRNFNFTNGSRFDWDFKETGGAHQGVIFKSS